MIYLKINEAEALVGVTRKNIRYYEDEGLLHPGRNSTNGYREYTDEDILALKKIKVYRKLSLPIEEIRGIMCGKQSAAETLGRHEGTLVKQKHDIDMQIALCHQISLALKTKGSGELSPDEYLNMIQQMESEGVSFPNVIENDHKKKIKGVWLAVSCFAAVLLALAAYMLWLLIALSIPVGIWIFIELLLVSSAVGVFIAGLSRVKEIRGGEEDDISKY